MKYLSLLAICCVLISCNEQPKTTTDTQFGIDTTDAEWAKKVVWYQIFPERFNNGDPNNDPTLADQHGAWPHDDTSAWNISPWGSDWYALQPWEAALNKPLNYHISRRRYGGDIQGIINKLDYLKNLGITAIYLNPIFTAPSLHKYDAEGYHHVDPTFGPDPDGDRKMIDQETPHDPTTWQWTSADKLALKLIEEAHNRGIRIIFDGVFNHLGINSFAFQDVKKNQQNSPYKDWFTVKSWDDDAAGTTFDYEGWFGVKDLPEIKEDSNGIVSGPKEYIFACTQRWMNPDNKGLYYGIDGWRLDVAFCVAHQFWKDWAKHVKSINPYAYTTAEVVDSIAVLKPYLQGDEFEAVMNYNIAFIASEYLIDDSTQIPTSEFVQKLDELRTAFPDGITYRMQNLFDSHDTNRMLSHIVNRDKKRFRNWGDFFGFSQVSNNPNYEVRKPTPYEYDIQKLMAIFQMTYVGAPMIYYGDEVGMWGANDPDCRKPMVWEELTYQPESTNPDGTQRPAESVKPNHSVKDHYTKLISIRNNEKALQLGTIKTLLVDDAKKIWVYERSFEGKSIIIALNNSNKTEEFQLPLSKGSYLDLLSNSTANFGENPTVEIKKKWAVILKKSEE